MPSTLPEGVAEVFTNAVIILGLIGALTTAAIYGITAWKYSRGLS